MSDDSNVHGLMQRILYEIKRVVVGQDHFLERILVAMLAQGHLLVEGVPGLAKTLTITEEQTAKLNALADDAMKLQDLLASQPLEDPERKLALKLRDAADERMHAVLTDSQKAKWKELTGEPWTELRKLIPSMSGGRGGWGSLRRW